MTTEQLQAEVVHLRSLVEVADRLAEAVQSVQVVKVVGYHDRHVLTTADEFGFDRKVVPEMQAYLRLRAVLRGTCARPNQKT